MSPLVEHLPVVVLYPHSRCNCRCIMCDIWKETTQREITSAEFDRLIEDFRKFSVRWVVLSGGEPLMHSNLFPFCARLREYGIRTTLLSTGLLLERNSDQIVRHIDDVIVSLDGPPTLHDAIRRVPGAFAQLLRGVDALRFLRPNFPVAARTTVQRANFFRLRETARAARGISLRSISFLAADVTSTAFNRPEPWSPDRQAEIALTAGELDALSDEIEALIGEWGSDPFLLDSPAKLRRIVLHYRAHVGLCEPEAPRCNAPWTSAVIESDGTLRPCFFHQSLGNVNNGLAAALNSPQALAFRSALDVSTNPVCRRCVCSLYWDRK